jgi:hypothetical protein
MKLDFQIRAVFEFLEMDPKTIEVQVEIFFTNASAVGKEHGLDLDEVSSNVYM